MSFKPKMENKAAPAPKETKGAPKDAKASGKGKPAASKSGKKGC